MTDATLFDIVPDTRHGHLGATAYIIATDEPEIRKGRTRRDDKASSIAGAESVAYRAGSQKAKLLEAYARAGARGLTDEQAAELAGLNMRSCFWKRCGELRQDGYIAETGEHRIGDAGVARLVSRVTDSGLRATSSTGDV
jgi:hypothetical protein